jgi:malate dehydrogenase (oxaloacetate-decarboxylating)
MTTRQDLTLAYTPGIAEVCKLIQQDPDAVNTHTFCRNNLAVISNGTAVLGLGNIGTKAGYPVMEGKAMLFKRFANIDAVPIMVHATDIEEFVTTVEQIADSFGAINLEDIAAPACFEIEERLKKSLSIPIMHDDQHGTAVVVLAALTNALQLVPSHTKSSRVVIVGSGSAGIAIAKLLMVGGFTNIVLVDSKGIISSDRSDLNDFKQTLASQTNPEKLSGSLADAVKGASIFIGVSKAGLLTPEMVTSMAPDSIVVAMANPVPEIMPDLAHQAGAALVATGRSDFANQVNNALAFPGIFRGAIDTRSPITEKMKLAAVQAIVEYHAKDLSREMLLPSIMDEAVHKAVADKVREAARA